MEFLLTNLPLDCPVCDQAGECSLQDYNYEYGPAKSKFVEPKRVWKEATTKRLSDKLTLNMNRCVHCERCVRFTEDVTKTGEFLMDNRGWHKELTTALDEGLFNEYQGNVADICPVGAITFNDFRFQKRVWFLKEKNGICDSCSKGCSVYADERSLDLRRGSDLVPGLSGSRAYRRASPHGERSAQRHQLGDHGPLVPRRAEGRA